MSEPTTPEVPKLPADHRTEEVPRAGADDLPAPEVAVAHPVPRGTSIQSAPAAGRRELTFRAVATAMVGEPLTQCGAIVGTFDFRQHRLGVNFVAHNLGAR